MAEAKLAPCLWFDRQAEEAARLYAGLFPNSSIDHVNAAPGDYPGGSKGDVITVEFTLFGQPVLALNGGDNANFSDAVSLQVFTEDQVETDRYWDALLADGGEPMMCSWLKDRFGMRWQIVPRVLMEGLRHPVAATRERVFAAMNEMVKIDVAAIEKAIAG